MVAGVRWRTSAQAWAAPAIVLVAAFVEIAFATAVFGISFTTGTFGRYFFPALPAMAVAIVIGWAALLPRRAYPALSLLPLALAALALITPFWLIRPTYMLANQVASTDRHPATDQTLAAFDGKIALVDATVTPARAAPGDQISVRLVWRALSDVGRSYRLLVQLLGPDDRAVVQIDQVPARGRASTALWRAGDLVFDDVTLTLPSDVPPGLYRATTGFYRLQDLTRLPAIGTGAQAGEVATIGTVKMLAQMEPVTHAPIASFGELALMDADFSVSTTPNPEVRGSLLWRAEQRPRANYVVSVQLLDQGRLVAQLDRPPGGWLPTTAWDPGDLVTDAPVIAVPADAPRELELQLVVYEPTTGQRLPVNGANALSLGTVSVALSFDGNR
jgi:hypothetical protein